MTEVNTTTGGAATAADLDFTISRVFDAPRHLVFKAWTEPERMMHWWSPQGFMTTSCEVDLRAGGAWRCCMRSPEGTEHTEQGIYREIVEPERLVFTHAWEDVGGKPGHETRVTVTFAEHGGKTTVGIHQAVFESVASRASHQEGWGECLDRLAGYLANA